MKFSISLEALCKKHAMLRIRKFSQYFSQYSQAYYELDRLKKILATSNSVSNSQNQHFF